MVIGVSAWYPDRHLAPRADTLPQRILRDMVNKWAVCIPLECILVYNKNDTITILPERHDRYTKWYLFQTKFVIDIHVMFHVETLLFTKYSRLKSNSWLLITRKFTRHNLLLHNLQYAFWNVTSTYIRTPIPATSSEYAMLTYNSTQLHKYIFGWWKAKHHQEKEIKLLCVLVW